MIPTECAAPSARATRATRLSRSASGTPPAAIFAVIQSASVPPAQNSLSRKNGEASSCTS